MIKFEFVNYWKCEPHGFITLLAFKFDNDAPFDDLGKWFVGIEILNFGIYLKKVSNDKPTN